MATLLQVIQGVIAGVSILGTTVAILYAASLGGVGIQLVVDGQVVEIMANTAMAASTSTETAVDTQEKAVDLVSAVAAPVKSEEADIEEADETVTVTEPPSIPASAVLDYYDLIAPDVSAAVISLGRLSQLLEKPRTQEEGWRTDVVQLIDMVADSYERLLRVRPPSEAVAIHSFLIDSTGRCLGVTESLSGDLTQVPDDLFPVIGKTLQRCTEETKSVVQQVY